MKPSEQGIQERAARLADGTWAGPGRFYWLEDGVGSVSLGMPENHGELRDACAEAIAEGGFWEGWYVTSEEATP